MPGGSEEYLASVRPIERLASETADKSRSWGALRGHIGPIWLLSTFALSLGYAVLRYNVLGGVAWAQLPLFVVNKAISVSAVALIASSYFVARASRGSETEREHRQPLIRFLGVSGFALAFLHSIMSLALLSPHYFASFFGDGRMNLKGEASVLFGVLALFWLCFPALGSLLQMQTGSKVQRRNPAWDASTLALFCVLVHIFVIGSRGWVAPSAWPGSMPPLTMIAFVVALLPLLARRLHRAGPQSLSRWSAR